MEFKELICDILSYIEMSIKSMRDLQQEEGKKISAIKYVNNLKKHSTAIFKYGLKSYSLYPSKHLYPSKNLHPSKFGIYGNELPVDNKKFRKQYDTYNEYLKGKEIFEIISK